MRYTIRQLWFRYLNHSELLLYAVLVAFAAAIFLLPWFVAVVKPLMRVSPWLGWCAVPVLFAPSAWLFGRGVWRARWRVRLISSGQPVCGVIIDVKTGHHRGRAWIDHITYQYRIACDGNTREYTVTCDAAPYKLGELLLGSPVLVLYDPNSPGLSEIDRFDARPDDRLRLSSAPTAPAEARDERGPGAPPT